MAHLDHLGADMLAESAAESFRHIAVAMLVGSFAGTLGDSDTESLTVDHGVAMDALLESDLLRVKPESQARQVEADIMLGNVFWAKHKARRAAIDGER